MKRPEPFYRPRKKRWYVQIDGKHVNLGPHPEGAPPPRKSPKGGWNTPPSLLDAYHAAMPRRAKRPPTPRSDHPLVVTILDAYLDWLNQRVQEGSKAERTYDWYKKYLQLFTTF